MLKDMVFEGYLLLLYGINSISIFNFYINLKN
jgi:hypothetical protein